jgi:hypothetical protein
VRPLLDRNSFWRKGCPLQWSFPMFLLTHDHHSRPWCNTTKKHFLDSKRGTGYTVCYGRAQHPSLILKITTAGWNKIPHCSIQTRDQLNSYFCSSPRASSLWASALLHIDEPNIPWAKTCHAESSAHGRLLPDPRYARGSEVHTHHIGSTTHIRRSYMGKRRGFLMLPTDCSMIKHILQF